MDNNQYLFHGISFFIGTELLPQDILLDLTTIRKWAFNSGYISDSEFQLMGEERVKEVSRVFKPEDKLLIALTFNDQHEKVDYFEFPYVPVQTLIKKNLTIDVLYWRISPYQESSIQISTRFKDVRFGFNIPDSNEEYCSISTAKKVVPKFLELMESVGDKGIKQEFSDGSKEITVDDTIQTTFHKEGRTFDVNFV